jgi:tRNA (pseudouridine54-N1)-methyltransferase
MRARTSDEFLIRDVPGTSGRLDVVCRILVAAYRTVPELAPSIRVNAVLGGAPNPPLCLEVDDVVPGEFPQSELECALILKGLLTRFQTNGEFISPLWPQFRITARGFHETLQTVAEQRRQILYLVETGQPIEQVKLSLDEPMVLILGDDQGLPAEHKKEVYTHSVQEVSIGTRSLLGSQVITLVLLELMRRQKKKEARSS